ncbi:MAG TPA: alpha/beta hydrolase, partial [Stenotrophomonas sp.]
MRRALVLLLSLALSAGTASAQPSAAYGPRLEGFDYPHPVHIHRFQSQGQDVEMAYLDVAPSGTPKGRSVVLLHGKNFCAATWQDTITALADAGYRVIAPDQI